MGPNVKVVNGGLSVGAQLRLIFYIIRKGFIQLSDIESKRIKD